MLQFSSSFGKLLLELKKLPGVGEKTALRLAFHLLKSSENMEALGRALSAVAANVRFAGGLLGWYDRRSQWGLRLPQRLGKTMVM